MANMLNTRVKNKRDTAANWETKNPVLLNGEIILVDTNAGEVRMKIGDGVKTYSQLPFSDEISRNNKMDKVDPVGSGSFSMNRKASTTIGDKSSTLGLNNEASGEGSVAEGTVNTASGKYSHVEGINSKTIGAYSHAEGQKTEANGWFSHTEGNETKTIGNNSHAEGNKSVAEGHSSHAEGDSNTAKGYGTHAEGYNTTATSSYSHTEGKDTKTLGDTAHAEGDGTIARGLNSHSEGYSTEANGVNSHAEGNDTVANGTHSHAEGYMSSVGVEGQGAHAEGINTQSNYLATHSEGMNTIAEGQTGHAEGTGSKAIGNTSHAEGNETEAHGMQSHTEGSITKAYGVQSHAEGYASVTGDPSHIDDDVIGKQAHAENSHTTAKGRWSHTSGRYTEAVSDAQFVIGRYNISDEGDYTTGGYSTNAFIVGNGTDSNNKSNAFEVAWNGDITAGGEVIDGHGNKLSEAKVTVDSELNPESENPLQNKVVAESVNQVYETLDYFGEAVQELLEASLFRLGEQIWYIDSVEKLPTVVSKNLIQNLSDELSPIIGEGTYRGWKIVPTLDSDRYGYISNIPKYMNGIGVYFITKSEDGYSSPTVLPVYNPKRIPDDAELVYVYSDDDRIIEEECIVYNEQDRTDTKGALDGAFANDLWFVEKENRECDKYILCAKEDRYELVGSNVDLSNYYTKPEVDGKIGDLTTLKTQEKSSIVNAINESIAYCNITFEESAIAEITDKYVKFAITTEQLNLIDNNFIVKFNAVPLNIVLIGYKQFGSIADRGICLVNIVMEYSGTETSMNNLQVYQDEDDNWYLMVLLETEEYTTYALTKERIQNEIIGDNSTLDTIFKGQLVGAINEVNAKAKDAETLATNIGQEFANYYTKSTIDAKFELPKFILNSDRIVAGDQYGYKVTLTNDEIDSMMFHDAIAINSEMSPMVSDCIYHKINSNDDEILFTCVKPNHVVDTIDTFEIYTHNFKMIKENNTWYGFVGSGKGIICDSQTVDEKVGDVRGELQNYIRGKSSETWEFELEDGTVITKQILIQGD